MKSTKAAAVCLSALFFLLAGAGAASGAEQKQTWGFVVPLGTNMQSENLTGLLKQVAEVASKSVGVGVVVYTPGYIIGEDTAAIVEDYFKSGKANLAYIHPRDMVAYMDRGGKLIYPIGTVEMFGKTSTDVCLYTRKKDGLKGIADLKGKVVGTGSTLSAIYRILSENGIKEPPDKFFSKMVFIADSNKNEMINALFDGRADAVAAEEYNMIIPLGSHKRGKEVEALHCSEQYHNWMFAASKRADPAIVQKMQQLLFRAHKDKTFQQFWWFLSAIKGRFVPVDETGLGRTRELIKLENKNGWFSKEQKFMKENWSKFAKK